MIARNSHDLRAIFPHTETLASARERRDSSRRPICCFITRALIEGIPSHQRPRRQDAHQRLGISAARNSYCVRKLGGDGSALRNKDKTWMPQPPGSGFVDCVFDRVGFHHPDCAEGKRQSMLKDARASKKLTCRLPPPRSKITRG